MDSIIILSIYIVLAIIAGGVYYIVRETVLNDKIKIV